MKFNRLGFIAGFGDRRVRMRRTGLRRYDDHLANPRPRPFTDEVHAPGYAETWVEGTVVLHNPNAVRPLDPALLVGATHEFLQPDGTIMTDTPQPSMRAMLDARTVDLIHNDLAAAAFFVTSRIKERLAKDERDGLVHEVIAALTLTAFTLEAYLNFVGAQVNPEWWIVCV